MLTPTHPKSQLILKCIRCQYVRTYILYVGLSLSLKRRHTSYCIIMTEIHLRRTGTRYIYLTLSEKIHVAMSTVSTYSSWKLWSFDRRAGGSGSCTPYVCCSRILYVSDDGCPPLRIRNHTTQGGRPAVGGFYLTSFGRFCVTSSDPR